ncbi:MAG: O-antigen ligase family protein, partial [Phocaeicola sp.]|nr:O-antigen ligase family protein [Phocaeicola sp.]
MEAVWGIRQVYGFTYSNHSLYALTGSFYNPGPYSGYLAMIFPVCLHEWLKRKEYKKTIPYYMAVAGMLLILCVLPAGMSRSAWIAAAVSSVYVCGMHYKREIQHYISKQAVSFAVVTCILSGIALGGIYQMKKDSADGRLFMWKIAAHAVSEHPWAGCGWNSVPAAYGQAQEDYFATGDYTVTEELVAGAPEYVFNEYLQVAIAWGVPVLCFGLLIMGGSMYIGHKQGIYGLCGALLSLMVFAFSSYPLQFPAFVSALVILVLACGIRVLPLEKGWFRLLFTILLLVGSYGCFYNYQQKSKVVSACKQWTKSRMFYQSGAYRQAVECYAEIQKEMVGNARFMFEYGHALHKLHEPELSNRVLKEALKVSGDPMILNVIGKNEQEMKHYASAEQWFMRAVHRLPGRIYPYYLL